jgi:hypothetical protein
MSENITSKSDSLDNKVTQYNQLAQPFLKWAGGSAIR